MASLLSPGVLTREIDLTAVVPAAASTEAGISLYTHWGPVDELVLISSESDLAEIFGKPSDDNAASWFTAKNFLSYSNSLYVSRALDRSAALNSSQSGVGVLIENSDKAEAYSGAELISAKYAGKLGDSLKIWVADSATFSGSTYEDEFTGGAPDLDEVHILVIDEDGLFTGVKGTILEKYEFLSKASDAKNRDGSTNYYKNVLNNGSSYVWILNDLHTDWGKPFDEIIDDSNPAGLSAKLVLADLVLAAEIDPSLSGGADGNMKSALGAADIEFGFDLFVDDELVDISFLLGADGGITIANKLLDIASSRKDCIAVVSPEITDVVNNVNPFASVKNYRNNLQLGGLKDLKSSYIVMDDNWKYQFDKYNNVNRWVPCNGDTAGLMAETDLERALWFSPGGRSLKNVIKLAWKSKRSERDVLYPLGVNSITTFPGEGAILFGDRTLLQRPSAFDRINVRRLFIYLRKVIARASRSLLFEQNTEYTRRRFIALVEPLLREIQARQGITDFRIVCDSTNNTGNVIDQNRFIGDIYIKPARSINFIELNFVAVRTDVEFSEVVGTI